MNLFTLLDEAVNTGSTTPAPKKKYRCPYCDERYERDKLHLHIQKKHEDMIPEGYTALRVAFNTINHKDHGSCIICGKETAWNEKKGRYERLCDDPKCKEKYKAMCAARNQRIYGTDRLQSDPRYAEEVQKKALAGRKTSGKYKFKDGGEISYMGMYEKLFLQWMDEVMECKSEDIIAPGPAIHYPWNGEEHLYLPDFYYIPYNLIIEIKDGGNNPNNHPHRTGQDEERLQAKEAFIKKQKKYNYLRQVNNDFSQLMRMMAILKFNMLDGNETPVVKIFNDKPTEYEIDDGRAWFKREYGSRDESVLDIDNNAFSLNEEAQYSEENKYPVFICLQHSSTLLANVIKMATRNKYTHATISFDASLDPLYCFGNKKDSTRHADPGMVVQSPHSQFFKNYKVRYAVYVMYVNQQAYEAMQKALSIFLEKQDELQYDFLNLISVWLGKSSEKSEKYFCSKFVAKIIEAGIELDKVPSLWKPDDFKKMSNVTLVNVGDDFKKYDPAITLSNLELVKQGKFEEIGLEESMAGTIGGAIPLNAWPKPHESDPDNYYYVPYMQNTVFAGSITNDPTQYNLLTTKPNDKDKAYKVYTTKKSDFQDNYLTFKIKDKQAAKELYEELLYYQKHDKELPIHEGSKDYIYWRLTGSNLLTEDQILFDNRFELVKSFDQQLQEECDELYKYLKAEPITLAEEAVDALASYSDYNSMYSVLPENINNIEDLIHWKNNFDQLTHYQRLISNDMSRMQYGEDNIERYNKLYAQLIDGVNPEDRSIYEATSDVSYGFRDTFDDFDRDAWNQKCEKAALEEKSNGIILMIDTEDFVERDQDLSNLDSAIARLKDKYQRFLELPEQKRTLANQIAMSIFGVDNYVLYDKTLNLYLTRQFQKEETDDKLVDHGFLSLKDLRDISANTDPVTESKLELLCLDLRHAKMRNDKEVIRSLSESIINLGWNPELPFDKEKYQQYWLKSFNWSEATEIDAVQAIKEAMQPSIEPITHTTEELKNKIVPVFVCLVEGNKLYSKGIKWFTDSKYSHASMGFDSDLGKLYTFTNYQDEKTGRMKNGFGIDSINKYLEEDPHMKVKLYAFFVTPEQRSQMMDAVDWYIEHQDETRYNFTNIFNILRRKPSKYDKGKMICSQFVYTILKIANLKMRKTKDSSKISPADIDELTDDDRFYVVYQGGLDVYDKRKVDDLCDKLLPTLPLERYGIFEFTYLKNLGEYLLSIEEGQQELFDEDYIFTESEDLSKLDKNFKQKSGIDFDIVDIRNKKVEGKIDKIEGKYKDYFKGFAAFEKGTDNFAGFIRIWPNWVLKEKYHGNMISPIEVEKSYRGYGLGNLLVKKAIDKYDANILFVYPDNKVAINMYKNLGFSIAEKMKDDKKTYYIMTRSSIKLMDNKSKKEKD